MRIQGKLPLIELLHIISDQSRSYPHYSWTFPSKLLASHQAEFFGNLIQGLEWIKQDANSKL